MIRLPFGGWWPIFSGAKLAVSFRNFGQLLGPGAGKVDIFCRDGPPLSK